jgi:hypothetical protein
MNANRFKLNISLRKAGLKLKANFFDDWMGLTFQNS